MSTEVAVNRRPQIVRPRGKSGLAGLLGSIAVFSQITIADRWGDFLGKDGLHGWESQPQLAPGMAGKPRNRARGDFGLKNGWNRLRLLGKPGSHPAKLGRVDCGQMDHAKVYAAFVVEELRPQRLGKPDDRVLRRTIGGLKRDASIGERRAHLDDRSMFARSHSLER